MGRPPALTPAQQDEVRRRLAAGEGVRALAAEFKVGKATIGRLAGHTGQIRKVAETLAAAQTALAELPPAHQAVAVNLAEQLRAVSTSMAAAAVHSADTAQRLHAMANKAVREIIDPEAVGTGAKLMLVGGLTKLANDAAVIPMGLISANRPTVDRLNQPKEEQASIDPKKLSPQALQELLAARDAVAE